MPSNPPLLAQRVGACPGDKGQRRIWRDGRHLFAIKGPGAWRYDNKQAQANPYQQEHDDLFEAIRGDKPFNAAEFAGLSTMTAILGRMCTYSGQQIEWEDAINSKIELLPKSFGWESYATGVARRQRLLPRGNARADRVRLTGVFIIRSRRREGVLPKSLARSTVGRALRCAPPEVVQTHAFRPPLGARGAHGVHALPTKPVGQHALESALILRAERWGAD